MAGPTVAAVVFTDVVGSTARDARLGPARADALRRALLDEALQVVDRHGGRLVKSLGDGHLSTFPSPSAAVDAAVELQQRTEQRGRARPDPVELRIGISVGEVTSTDDGDCFGTPVVEAARLCDAAAPKEILVAEHVRLLSTNAAHPWRSAGERRLKGLTTPLATSSVEWHPVVEGRSFSMADVDADADLRRAAAGYLDRIGAAPHMRSVRHRLLELLDLRPGDAVLDVGCGTGDDVAELAALVGGEGRVIGVDSSEAMIEEAERRTAGWGAVVDLRRGDAAALPLDDDTVDRARSDRVFQYLVDPLPAMRELVRVTRPGGLVVVADTDWETAIFDSPDDELTARVNEAWLATRPNGRAGQQLRRAAIGAGLAAVTVEGLAQVKTDLDDLYRNGVLPALAQNAVGAGAVTPEEASRWLAMLEGMAAEGTFLRAFTTFVVTGRVP